MVVCALCNAPSKVAQEVHAVLVNPIVLPRLEQTSMTERATYTCSFSFVARCDVPRDALSLFPRQKCDTVRSLPIGSEQAYYMFIITKNTDKQRHSKALLLLVLLLLTTTTKIITVHEKALQL